MPVALVLRATELHLDYDLRCGCWRNIAWTRLMMAEELQYGILHPQL